MPIIQENVNTVRKNANATWQNLNATRHKAAQHNATHHKAVQHKAATAWKNTTTAMSKAANTMDKALVKAETIVSTTAALDSPATDCLRLSMHFFHPIQQCAQQIYLSALPLSPMSSPLRSSCLQMVIDNQLSCITAFSGAHNTWGLLLRTIDVRPRQLTCIATFAQRIIAGCEDIVNIYDAVTFVLQQSLQALETVTNIQGSPDGSILYFAHSFSVTMWDVQTGGLIHTFTTQKSKINGIAVSTTGDHIACGSSDGSVAFWNIHTKEGRGFGNSQPVVVICWLSRVELAVVTQASVYIVDTTIIHTSNSLSFSGCIWGMVYLGDELLVGTSQSGVGVDQELSQCYFEVISHQCQPQTYLGQLEYQKKLQGPAHIRQLMHPICVGKKIVCITPPSGVRSFDTDTHDWTNSSLLLGAAISVAVSLNRNLVVQAKDFIQIFTLDVLKTGEACDDVHPSHIYPLGEKHIVCLQPDKHPTLLELETLKELRPDDTTSPLQPLLTNQPPPARTSVNRGLVAEFGVSAVVRAWQSGTPLPEWTEEVSEDAILSGLSPECTRVVTVYGSPQQELRVKDANDGTVLASLSLEDVDLGTGKVYNLIFDSETRFYLEVDGPGWHIQVPYNISTSPSGPYSHTITKGDPIPLSEPRATPPYTVDANCEWVIDAGSRKICWISPGNIRRGNGGHFWAGLSLIMVGDDGVVRKLTFREPNC